MQGAFKLKSLAKEEKLVEILIMDNLHIIFKDYEIRNRIFNQIKDEVKTNYFDKSIPIDKSIETIFAKKILN